MGSSSLLLNDNQMSCLTFFLVWMVKGEKFKSNQKNKLKEPQLRAIDSYLFRGQNTLNRESTTAKGTRINLIFT